MVGWHHQFNGREFEQIWEIVKDRETWCALVNGVSKSWIQLSDWITTSERSQVRSSWIIWAGAQSNDKCPYVRQAKKTQIQKQHCDHRGRDGSDATTSTGMQKLEKSRDRISPRTSLGRTALPIHWEIKTVTLTVLTVPVRFFSSHAFYWNLADVFLIAKMGICIPGRKTTEMKYTVYQMHVLSTRFITADIDLGHLLQVVFPHY